MLLVHPQFDPIAIQLGPVSVRWYGLMYLLAFVAGLVLGRLRIRMRPELGWTARDLDDLLFYCVIGVVLGGRLGYVLFYKLAEYMGDPIRILYVWEGGMSFHGGFLGVILAMLWFARRSHRRWLEVTDFLAPLVPAGTILHTISWHDNSTGNKANPDPKNWVGDGQRTIDEMGFAWIGWYDLSDDEYKAEVAARKAALQKNSKTTQQQQQQQQQQ